MALNLGGGGDFPAYLKYNAKAGRFYIKGDEGEVEIANPTFIADLGNIKTGWFLYAEGQAPSIAFDANLSTPAAKPSDKHKRGFKMEIYSEKTLGGLVEFASASMHACNAVNELYGAWEKDKDKYPGQYPVVACTGTAPQKDKLGTNYKPIFAIQKWVSSDAFNKSNVVPITTAPTTGGVAPQVIKATAVSEF